MARPGMIPELKELNDAERSALLARLGAAEPTVRAFHEAACNLARECDIATQLGGGGDGHLPVVASSPTTQQAVEDAAAEFDQLRESYHARVLGGAWCS